ncbi:MAG: S1C family serine protease [Nitrososphaeraceae archaeon]
MITTSIIITTVFFLFMISFYLNSPQTQIVYSVEYAGTQQTQARVQQMQMPMPILKQIQQYHGINSKSNGAVTDNSSMVQSPLTATTTSSSILNKIFKETQDSVVQITRTVPRTGMVLDPLEENRTALGSGFLFDYEGHIITNNHVVGDAKIVDITFTNGDRLRANVTAVDPYIDIAVLRIIETQNNTIQQGQLNPLVLGNSSALVVGDQVVAIGNPYGLAGTMTTGIISQVDRLVPAPGSEFSVPGVIQTDAAINPGNSGGPLLNMQGQVAGLNFAALGQEGLGFAIPANLIQKIVPILIEKGNYTHPYLGFSGTTLTSDLASSIENITQDMKGAFVNTIVMEGPADEAGLQGTTIDQYGRKHGGDVIIGVDGDKIGEIEQLVSYLEQKKTPGDTVVLEVYRNGKTLELEAIIEERPSPTSTDVVN